MIMKKGSWSFKAVSDHWDGVDYDSSNSNIDSYYRRFLDTKEMVNIPQGSKVLDIDCRSGNGTVFFKQLYPNSTFFSGAMSESFKQSCSERLEKNDLVSNVFLMMIIPYLSRTIFLTIYLVMKH